MANIATGSPEKFVDRNVVEVDEGSTVGRAQDEMQLAKVIGESLVRTYPKRQWGVKVDLEGLMIVITCPSLSLIKGYHIAMDGHNVIELVELARRGAGEILERYNISRKRHINGELIESLIIDPHTGEALVKSGSTDGEEPIKRGR